MFLAAGLLLRAEDPSEYRIGKSWPEAVTSVAGIDPANRDQIARARIALRRDYPMLTISFFPKNESLEQWMTSKTSSYPVEMINRVLRSLGNSAKFAARRDDLVARNVAPRDPAWVALFSDAYEALRREVIAKVPRIAMVERAPNSRRGTNAIMFSIRPTAYGSALWTMDPKMPGASLVEIFRNPNGYIFDLSPSYDGKKFVFGYRENPQASNHIWEIAADGSGLRQITSGPYHDFNPVYYPDGRIIFCSSRVESYSLCQNYLASALYACDSSGGNIRRFDFTTLCTIAPAVLPDGSIVCTRWEYQDKNIFSWQGIWTIYPNGRQLKLYYGNTLTVPNSRYGPKPIPGERKVMITMAGHHHPPVGDLAIIDRSKGVESLDGIQQITFETSYRPAQGKDFQDRNWGPGDIFYPWAYSDPWPLDGDLSLVTYGGPPPEEGGPGRTRICVVTDSGVLFELCADPVKSFCCAVPLSERPMPMTIAGDAPQVAGVGTFFVQDVYLGLLEQGVSRGQVKELRIWQQVPKKYNTEGPRFHDHYPIVGYGSYYVKVNLGTVPVDENGSAYFNAPSNVELYFQAIDAAGKEVSRMGSVTQITTGETVSCVGCHENRLSPPPPAPAKSLTRLGRPPDKIRPPSWGAGTVDYVRLVQPVLDRYCVRCHSGGRPGGHIDLSGDNNRFFNMSYEALCLHGWVEHYFINQGPTGVFPALKTGSMVSRLSALIEGKHQGVDMDAESRKRIYSWIDANVPYYGTWEMSRPHTMGGRDTWSEPSGYLPWFKKIQSIVIEVAKRPAGSEKVNPDALIPNASINLTHPEWSRLLLDHLAKAGGGSAPDDTAWFASTTDARYQAVLEAIREGRKLLLEKPRMDMPGGVGIPQDRDFGRLF